MANKFVEMMGEVPRLWRNVAISASMVASVVEWLTYTGVYRWIGVLQFAMAGTFSKKLNVVFTVLLNLLLFSLIARLLVALKVIRRATREEYADHLLRDSMYRAGTYTPIMLAIMVGPSGMIALVAGLYAKMGGGETTPTVLTLEQVLNDTAPSDRYVTIAGVLRPDAAVGLGPKYSMKNYIPMVPTEWKAGDPVMVFIESRDMLPDGERKVTGMRWPFGLPGLVREEFEKAGANVPRTMLIDVDSSPGDWSTGGMVLLIAGGAATAFAAGAVGWELVKRKRG